MRAKPMPAASSSLLCKWSNSGRKSDADARAAPRACRKTRSSLGSRFTGSAAAIHTVGRSPVCPHIRRAPCPCAGQRSFKLVRTSQSNSVGSSFLASVARANQRCKALSRNRPPPTAGKTMIAAEFSFAVLKSCSILRALYDDASQCQIVTETFIEVHTRNIRSAHNPQCL